MKNSRFVIMIAIMAVVSVLAVQKPAGATLSITGSPTSVTMTLVKADIDAGYLEKTADIGTYAVTLSVVDTGPVYWEIRSKAATANFTAVNGGVKPCSALQYRRNGTGAYTALTTSDVALITGSASADVNVDYKFITSIYDKADTYSLSVVYTVVQTF
jgi:hypothetical protein